MWLIYSVKKNGEKSSPYFPLKHVPKIGSKSFPLRGIIVKKHMSTYIATGNCKKMQTESFNRFLVKFNALRIRVLVLMLGDSICAAGIFWLVLWGYRFLGNKEYGLERYWNFLPFLLIPFWSIVGRLQKNIFPVSHFYFKLVLCL